MAIQRNPLQMAQGSAPQKMPDEDSFLEWLGKTTIDRSLQGLVGAGSDILVEHATNEMKTNRQIKAATASADAQGRNARTKEAQAGVRGALKTYETADASVADALMQAGQLEMKIAGRMESTGVSKSFFGVEDFNTLSDNIEKQRKAAKERYRAGENLTDDEMAVAGKTSDKDIMTAWDAFQGRTKSISTNFQKMKNPKLAGVQLREAVRAFRSDIRAVQKNNNRMFLERLIMERDNGGTDKSGKPLLNIDKDNIVRFLQGRKFAATARALEVSRRQHLLAVIGPDAYLELEKTGGIIEKQVGDEGWVPFVSKEDPGWKEWSSHLSPAVRDIFGVDYVDAPDETGNMMFGVRVPNKHMSIEDKKDKNVSLMFFSTPPPAKDAMAVLRRDAGSVGRHDGSIYSPEEIKVDIARKSHAENWANAQRLPPVYPLSDITFAEPSKKAEKAKQSPDRHFAPRRAAEAEEAAGERGAEPAVPFQVMHLEPERPKALPVKVTSSSAPYLKFMSTEVPGE